MFRANDLEGGASAMFTGFSFPKKLGGFMLLSCYLPNADEFEKNLSEANKNTNFLMCHGEDDTMVHYQYGKKSYEKLLGYGLKGNFLSYPGTLHS